MVNAVTGVGGETFSSGEGEVKRCNAILQERYFDSSVYNIIHSYIGAGRDPLELRWIGDILCGVYKGHC